MVKTNYNSSEEEATKFMIQFGNTDKKRGHGRKFRVTIL